jgi:outer membrane protein assembly factor BamB
MKRVCILFALMMVAGFLQAQVVQWRGPERNGHFPSEDLLRSWPEGGPEVVLKVDDLGGGYSSPVLYKGNIYISGKKDSLDYLTKLDLQGNIDYQVSVGRAWEKSYPESRSTPTIEEDRIYLISGMGEVTCVHEPDGSILWSVDAHTVYKGELHRWGVAESPLIVDNLVVYTTGGEVASVVAFDKMTGEEVWKAKSLGGPKAFVSPVLYDHGGVRQIIAVTADHVLGIDPGNGDIMWTYEQFPEDEKARGRATIKTNSPIYRKDEIFLARGYDQITFKLRMAPDGNAVEPLWSGYDMDTHHGGYVLVGDYLYGSNWESNSQGKWMCVDWKTGMPVYEEDWITKGSIVTADGMLYCYEERSGNLALVEPTPEGFLIKGSLKIEDGTGPHWAHPYIDRGYLLVRHGDVLYAFDIRKARD